MSVALLITRKKDGKDELIPIATESVFIGMWNPIIRQLKLEWMPLFQTGVPVEAEDMVPVIKEVEAFIDLVSKILANRPDYSEVHARAVNLLKYLIELKENGFEELYIG